MTILNAGTSAAEFPGTYNTNSTGANLPFGVSEGIILTSDPMTIYSGGAVSEIWVSFTVNRSSQIPRDLVVFSNNGNPVLALRQLDASGGRLQFRYWDGSSWVPIDTDCQFPAQRQRVDIRFKIDELAGSVDLWINKVYQIGAQGINTIYDGVTGVDSVEIGTIGSSTVATAIIVADEDTRPLQYVQLLPSGAGELTEWTGEASTVSGSTGYSDSTFMSTDLADQKQTFALPNLPSNYDTGWTVEAVFATARARKDLATSSELRVMARSGTDEAFGDQVALTTLETPYNHQFTVDPATAAPWTIAGVNAVEVGVQSRAPT